MSKQQTAVEWLVGKLSDECATDYSHAKAHRVITLDFYTYEQFIQQAKAMEKEQIIKAFNQGTFSEMEKIDAEDYYNQTYGTKKSD